MPISRDMAIFVLTTTITTTQPITLPLAHARWVIIQYLGFKLCNFIPWPYSLTLLRIKYRSFIKLCSKINFSWITLISLSIPAINHAQLRVYQHSKSNGSWILRFFCFCWLHFSLARLTTPGPRLTSK